MSQQIFDTSKANHSLMAFPYMLTANFSYSPYPPYSRNIVDKSTNTINSVCANCLVSLYSCKDTYLNQQLLNQQDKNDIEILPIAVRYADVQNGVYVVERPPFQIPIDYYSSKDVGAKMPNYLVGRKMWIPWTILVVAKNNDCNDLICRLYFSDKSLSSFEDRVIKPFTPNLFDDSKICFGNSTWTFNQRITSGDLEYNLSNIYNYLFNDYFTQWNSDLSYRYTDNVFNFMQQKGIFARISLSKEKKKPNGFNTFYNWARAKTAWPYMLYCLSHLTFQETMDLVNELKEIPISSFSQSVSPYYSSNPMSQLIKWSYDSSVIDFSSLNITISDIFLMDWHRVHKDQIDKPPLLDFYYTISIDNLPSDVKNDALFTNVQISPEGNFSHLFANHEIIKSVYEKFFNHLNEALLMLKKKYPTIDVPECNLDSIFYSPFNNFSIYRSEFKDLYFTITSDTKLSFDYNKICEGVYVNNS